MSQQKIKKEEGQVSIRTLRHQTSSAKKRTPPSAEGPNKKKSHIEKENSSSSILQESYISRMEGENQTNSISRDTRFSNFSDEFIVFGNMMCQMLNEIVQPLKSSQDSMQDSMKLLLEDRQNYKNVTSICDKVEKEQENITARCDRMEQENKDLRIRLN